MALPPGSIAPGGPFYMESTMTDKTLIRPDTDSYSKGRAASGATTLNNGDMVAKGLEGATTDQVFTLAADLMDEPEGELRQKYDHLNPGMQRMALGNRIRGWIKRKDQAENGLGTECFNEEAAALRRAIEAA